MKNFKILTTDVAKLIGKSDLTVREGIKREYFDFGIAMQLPGSEKYNYTIFPAKVAEMLGISVEELYRKVEELRNEAKTA
jgi:hypothetical protein